MAQNAVRAFEPTGNSVPSVYYASNATPTVTVQLNFPTCGAARFQIPIPLGAMPGNGSSADAEAPMVIANSDTGDEWDLFKATPPGATPKSSGPVCPATSNWAATVITRNSPGWTGMGVGNTYAASGLLGGGGLMRPRDTQKPAGATWDHALSMSYPRTRNTYVAPATRTDGPYSDAASIPMGSRIQLDPAFDVNSLAIPEWQKQMLRTMQVYGVIVVDSGSAIHNEGYASAHASGYRWPWESGGPITIPSSVVSHFRVLR
jgi:hypothetical protein